jgi:colicin import membrane protein
LKVYQTSQGFYDRAVAARLMKAAIEARGAASNLFHEWFAKEANEPKVIAAATAKLRVVLQRPVGSDAAQRKADESEDRGTGRHRLLQMDNKAQRRAAAAFEKGAGTAREAAPQRGSGFS